MNDQTFDGLARRAGVIRNRRASLKMLGAAALAAAIESPRRTVAGKAGKRAKKKCRKQVKQCRAFFTEFCGGSPGCEGPLLPCCGRLGRCKAAAFLECMLPVFA